MKAKASAGIDYLLSKGGPRVFEARVPKKELRLHVNGPGMLFGTVRLLTSLDAMDGATYRAWKKLAAVLTCTSFCGRNGKTKIPVQVKTSRIGTHLEFSTGPMSMYQTLVVLKPRKDVTLKAAIDEAFGKPRRKYSVVLVPEPAEGHAEHDASIFEPDDTHGGHHH